MLWRRPWHAESSKAFLTSYKLASQWAEASRRVSGLWSPKSYQSFGNDCLARNISLVRLRKWRPGEVDWYHWPAHFRVFFWTPSSCQRSNVNPSSLVMWRCAAALRSYGGLPSLWSENTDHLWRDYMSCTQYFVHARETGIFNRDIIESRDIYRHDTSGMSSSMLFRTPRRAVVSRIPSASVAVVLTPMTFKLSNTSSPESCLACTFQPAFLEGRWDSWVVLTFHHGLAEADYHVEVLCNSTTESHSLCICLQGI